ncbi:hypothetical protein [Allopontixanthobacter sp.]|uniref:hypothetical protein n=1 Tax=Allopontixanthobacter sp. TaxID=2906452 RepID=UPI002AB9AED6|nr:hypothetical protein [Allopontixanthobacter sp.]MDZ4308288.1 hypothetical protein [Allopontixanthobacter sp.]
MPKGTAWLNRLVNSLANSKFFNFLAGHVLVPFWAWRTPVYRQHGGPHAAAQPGDNMQRMMNLVLPLKDKTAVGRAKAALAIASNLDQIYAGLDNVGTVHFARFVIINNNMCMISSYDGDFSNYIRDFVAQLGTVFDSVVALIEDGDRMIPTNENIDAFINWVHDRDVYQIPDVATDLLRYGTIGHPAPAAGSEDDLRLIPRALILQLHANPNALLGSGYRGYPGITAAQIRHKMGLGW